MEVSISYNKWYIEAMWEGISVCMVGVYIFVWVELDLLNATVI